ncbi:inhibitor of growth protein 1-like [Limulus polyphemus]|uniref:Inhibitor of growth protein n=1 Tax=Limulus polyphemus TaxID=6850 RepID=A0ABM1BVJ5_LIMPO|nr:inhibitor of growth protein 1-like [Limulus polyphemus]
MLNQAAIEAMYSAAYVEDYLDCVENLPNDVQRNITQLRELDLKYQEVLQELDHHQISLQKEIDGGTRKRTLLQIQRALIRSQDLGDEKLQLLQQMQDLIENKSRQLDQDHKNLDFGRETVNHTENHKNEVQPERSSKRARRHRNYDSMYRDESFPDKHERETFSGGGGRKQKKKRRKTKAERELSPLDPPIDPDEPTYCLCEQVSFGEMIGCDNEECTIEWFHFSCVGLTTKPKGKWYCPKCRGDRSNQMKPKNS